MPTGRQVRLCSRGNCWRVQGYSCDEYEKVNFATRFIYSCHITSLKAYDASGVKCVCSDLKDFDQVYMLEYGHLSALEGAADNLAYDVVFVVGCSEKTLRKRILTRGERAGDWLDEDTRLTKWLKGTGVYKGGGNRGA